VTQQAGVRYVYSKFGTRQVGDLIQTIVTAELMQRSRRFWIVSPWISDIPVLDNRNNAFSTIVPGWAHTQVRLSSVLLRLLDQGSTVHVVTRANEAHNRDFLSRLRELAGSQERLFMHSPSELHDKGLLGDGYYLGGSMNFTFSGISVNEEALHFTTDRSVVAQQHVSFAARWQG
jgi:hypothetical protein